MYVVKMCQSISTFEKSKIDYYLSLECTVDIYSKKSIVLALTALHELRPSTLWMFACGATEDFRS